MGMVHLRLANGAGMVVPSAGEMQQTERCLLDYSSCSVSDICWLLDLAGGCDASDHCIIDTS